MLLCIDTRSAKLSGSSDADIYNQRGQVLFNSKNYKKVGSCHTVCAR